MKKLTLLALLALLLAAVGPAFAANPFDVGQPAIDFTILNWDTKKDFVLADHLKKSKMVFAYFSSTCSACRSEVVDVKKASDAGEIDKSVEIYFVNIDFNDANIASYKTAQGLEKFTILHDPKFVTPSKYGIRSTPALLVIGKDGNIGYRRVGYEAGDLKEVIKGIQEAK